MVMNNPFDRRTDPLNYDIFERFFTHIDIVKKRKEYVEDVTKNVLENINNNLKDLSPELMINFNMVYKELTTMIKEHDKIVKSLEKKSKKLFESSTLTEDVYTVRDEVKLLKKKIDKLNSGLKGFARLGDLISEDGK